MDKGQEKKPDKNCDHVWKQTGYWDGDAGAGPSAQCTKCGGIIRLNWEKWNVLPEEKKIELLKQ